MSLDDLALYDKIRDLMPDLMARTIRSGIDEMDEDYAQAFSSLRRLTLKLSGPFHSA